MLNYESANLFFMINSVNFWVFSTQKSLFKKLLHENSG